MLTIHVTPVDGTSHHTACAASDCACECGFDVMWIDEDTGLPLAAPLVIHVARGRTRGWINKRYYGDEDSDRTDNAYDQSDG